MVGCLLLAGVLVVWRCCLLLAGGVVGCLLLAGVLVVWWAASCWLVCWWCGGAASCWLVAGGAVVRLAAS